MDEDDVLAKALAAARARLWALASGGTVADVLAAVEREPRCEGEGRCRRRPA